MKVARILWYKLRCRRKLQLSELQIVQQKSMESVVFYHIYDHYITVPCIVARLFKLVDCEYDV